MRIERLTEVWSGGLRDRSLRLGEGLTVVFGPNVTGKSSWHVALFAALYGRAPRSEAAADRRIEAMRPHQGDRWQLTAEIALDSGRRIEVVQDLMRQSTSVAGMGLPQELGLDRRSFTETAWLSDLIPWSSPGSLGDAIRGHLGDEAAEAAEAWLEAELHRIDPAGQDGPYSWAHLCYSRAMVKDTERKQAGARAREASREWTVAQDRAFGLARRLRAAQVAAALKRCDELQAKIDSLRPQGAYPAKDLAVHYSVVTAEQRLTSAQAQLRHARGKLGGEVTVPFPQAAAPARSRWGALFAGRRKQVVDVSTPAPVSPPDRPDSTVLELEVRRWERETDTASGDLVHAIRQRGFMSTVEGGARAVYEAYREESERNARAEYGQSQELVALQQELQSAALAARDTEDLTEEEVAAELSTDLARLEQTCTEAQIGVERANRVVLECLRLQRESYTIQNPEMELSYAEPRFQRLDEVRTALRLALENLRQARADSVSGAVEGINTWLSGYLPSVLDTPGLSVRLDDELRLRISDDPEGRFDDEDAAANSNKMLAHLFARIALGRHLTRRERESCPLFLDVSWNIDDGRLLRVLEKLRDLAVERQVVVFLHQRSAADWAQRRAAVDPKVTLVRLNGPVANVDPHWSATSVSSPLA